MSILILTKEFQKESEMPFTIEVSEVINRKNKLISGLIENCDKLRLENARLREQVIKMSWDIK